MAKTVLEYIKEGVRYQIPPAPHISPVASPEECTAYIKAREARNARIKVVKALFRADLEEEFGLKHYAVAEEVFNIAWDIFPLEWLEKKHNLYQDIVAIIKSVEGSNPE